MIRDSLVVLPPARSDIFRLAILTVPILLRLLYSDAPHLANSRIDS